MVKKQKTTAQRPSVLMTAAECAPFAKTGGLADVVGTLTRELKKNGFDIRLILPFHHVIKETYKHKTEHVASFSVDLGWRSQYVGIERLDWDGIPVYFIDNEYYFGHMIYCGGNFEGEQYAYFSRAVLEALPIIGFIPDIIHVNDWHTAIIPMLAKTQYESRPQGKCKTVLSMHSLGYQGKFDFAFATDFLEIDVKYYHSDYFEHYGSVNFLKAGIVFADKLVTVSPTYAREIRTQYYGEGLDGILNARADDLVGILNGIDEETFNPKTDPLIPYTFDADTLGNKQKNKEALLSELGLMAGGDTPLVAMVTRLTGQKGLDLIRCVFDDMMQADIAFALLGTGEQEYEDYFRSAAARYPGKVAAILRFDEAFSHKLYAAGDFLLMPSRFEPCGISQMIALRYGTLPIVRETGGLKDTVTPYNQYTGEGNGFSFENYNAHDMLHMVQYALDVCKDQARLLKLRKNGMAQDLSFKKSALTYAALYAGMMPPQ